MEKKAPQIDASQDGAAPEAKPEAKLEAITLETSVVSVLKAAGTPLRAVDIVKKLAELKVVATSTDVNKVLYNGPFEKVSDLGKPTWRYVEAPVVHLRPAGMHTFTIEGLAVISIPVALDAPVVESLLSHFRTLAPAGVLRVEATPAGARLGEIAQKVGFALGAPLGGTL